MTKLSRLPEHTNNQNQLKLTHSIRTNYKAEHLRVFMSWEITILAAAYMYKETNNPGNKNHIFNDGREQNHAISQSQDHLPHSTRTAMLSECSLFLLGSLNGMKHLSQTKSF